jgi:hypothetical protein
MPAERPRGTSAPVKGWQPAGRGAARDEAEEAGGLEGSAPLGKRGGAKERPISRGKRRELAGPIDTELQISTTKRNQALYFERRLDARTPIGKKNPFPLQRWSRP